MYSGTVFASITGVFPPSSPTNVTIGSSGNALVSITVRVYATGGLSDDMSCQLSFSLNGGEQTGADTIASVLVPSGYYGEMLSSSATVLLTGLSPGTNTFEAQYKSSDGNMCSFTESRIYVQPQ